VPDGPGHGKAGPAGQRSGASACAAAGRTRGRGPPGGDLERRGGVWLCADAWDRGSTGQRPRVGKKEGGGGESEAVRRVLLVRAALFLGHTFGASAMAGASDSTRAKKARGVTPQCHLGFLLRADSKPLSHVNQIEE
jgi:hypothetical protein